MYSVSVPEASSGYMEYVGGKPEGRAAGAAEGLEDLLEHFVGAVGGPDVLRAQSVAKVLGEGFAQFGELAVRIPVQSGSGGADGLGDGRADIGRDPMGVLVDVEQDGDVQLRRAIRAQATQIGSEGQSVEALKLVSHVTSLSGSGTGAETVTPATAPGGQPYLDGTNSCWPGITRAASRLFSCTMSATTSRGSRSGATDPAMAQRDSPGWTVTDTVGVTRQLVCGIRRFGRER